MKSVSIIEMIPSELNSTILNEFISNGYEIIRNTGVNPDDFNTDRTLCLYFSFKRGSRTVRFTIVKEVRKKRNGLILFDFKLHMSQHYNNDISNYIKFTTSNHCSDYTMNIDIPSFTKMEDTKAINHKEMKEGKRVNEFKSQLLLPYIEGAITSNGFKLRQNSIVQNKNLRCYGEYSPYKMLVNIEMVQKKYAELADTEIEDTLFDVYTTINPNSVCFRMKASSIGDYLTKLLSDYKILNEDIEENKKRISSVNKEIHDLQVQIDALRKSIIKDTQTVKNIGFVAIDNIKKEFKDGAIQNSFWKH